jgi:NAD-dependent oxidoreductase involved in siderophore biosynthesis
MSPEIVLIGAHFGHWYVSLLYLAPVFVIVGALSIQSLRERRRANDGEDPDDGGGPVE